MPTLAGFQPSVVFAENLVNATPQILDGDVVFRSDSEDYDGGHLILSGLLAEDRVSVRNEGTGAGQIGLSGNSVTFGGVVIGTLSGGVGTTLTIVFNAAATTAAIDALIQNLTYANVSDTPTGSRNLVLDVIDGAGRSTTAIEPSSFAVQVDNPTFSIDIGSEARPELTDLDGDGDLDLVIGTLTGTVAYFENTGTPEAPSYQSRTGAANPFDGIDVGFRAAPILADLDGDGDLDALIGNEPGVFSYFENTGTRSSPVFVERTGAANPMASFVGPPGTATSQMELADVDGDGDLDALIATNASGTVTLRYLENTGSEMMPVFAERTGAANPFDGLAGSSASLVDRDNDGDLDLVLVQRGVIPGSFGTQGNLFNYFENVGATESPQFVQRTGSANPFEGLASTTNLTATFGDRDRDGDLDIILGRGDGTLAYVLNTTQPSGTAVIRVEVTPQGDAPGLDDQTPTTSFDENLVNESPQRLLVDPATTLFIRDGSFAGDDLVILGLRPEDRISVRTEGNGPGQIALNVPDVPPGTISPPPTTVSFGGVVIGTLSTLVGATAFVFNASATTEAIEALLQNLTYANVSDTPTASRTLRLVYNDAFAAPLSGVDVGSNGTPTFVDFDADGDIDIVAGELDGILNWFENTGTTLQPTFVQRTGVANPLEGIDVGARSTPSFADLDGDGDLDLIVGETDGVLNYFQNTGTAFAPIFVEQTGAANPFNGIDVGSQSAPTFGDLDGDGDLDMFVGTSTGLVQYFENTGSATVPVFEARTGAANPLNGVNVSYYAKPLLLDIDGDGDLDALVGRYASTLRLFRNIGTEDAAVFQESAAGTFTVNAISFGSSGAPAAADVDGDGDLDFLVGISNGTFSFSRLISARPEDPALVVTVNAQNDRPALANLPLDLTVVEDVESHLNLSVVTLTDGDLVDVLTVVLTASAGVLTSVGTETVGVSGSGSSALTLTGTASAIDAFLNVASSIRYMAPANVSGGNVADLTITADDGSGAVQLGTINIDVTAVNDPPSLSGLDPAVTVLATHEGVEPTLLDADVTFVDVDEVFQGAVLSVNGLLAEDRVSIQDQGTGAGQIGLSGTSVTFGGVMIGTLSGGVGGTLNVTFNAAATSAAVEATIENLTFANVSPSPTLTRTLVLNFIDAAGEDLIAFRAVSGAASPVNDISVGSYAAPMLADVDGDGDLDLLLGSYSGDFSYFENTGTQTEPVFVERSGGANPFDGVYGGTRSQISLADLDGDGDLDVLAGGSYGSGDYYENVGSATTPVYEERSGSEAPFGLDVFSGSNIPVFADLDGDGDLDAISSPGYGDVRYFENTGSATAPVFVRRQDEDNPFDGINVGRNARATAADLDGDGDLDVVIGSGSGEVIYFENLSTPGDLNLVRRTGSDNPLFGLQARVSVTSGDLNGDGVPDLIFGNGSSLTYVESETTGTRTIVVTVSPVPVLDGTPDGDVLIGTSRDDVISGGAGNDDILGGGRNDIVDGGAGNDTLRGGAGPRDIAAYGSATSGVTVSLAQTRPQDTGGAGIDALRGFEGLSGSAFDDVLTGNRGENILRDTQGGDDLLSGRAGNDKLSVIRSGAGAATSVELRGGEGDDVVTFDGGDRFSDAVTVFGDQENDAITVTGAGTASIFGGIGDDTIVVDALGGAYTLTLGAGSDTVRLAPGEGGAAGATGHLIRDFDTGPGGDVLDLSAWLASGVLSGFTVGSNPFASGHLRLIQAGSQTLLQVDQDGGGDGYVTLLTFRLTTASSFAAANLNGIEPFGPAPAAAPEADKFAMASDFGPLVLPGLRDDGLTLEPFDLASHLSGDGMGSGVHAIAGGDLWARLDGFGLQAVDDLKPYDMPEHHWI